MKSVINAVPLERLLEQLPENYTLADRELIHRAYRVAEEAHREQKRHSGEPYINHCLAVASILADLRVQPEVVAAGLLHDTVEDTPVTLNDIRRDFGQTIEIGSGLAASDRVIQSPPDGLDEGDAVRVAQPAKTDAAANGKTPSKG